jgi:hypothetical protein
MAPTRQDLQLAIAAYWKTKGAQLEAARAIDSSAEGTAGAVRAAGHFTSIASLLARFFTDAGYPVDSIRTGRTDTVLPGYFRPSKAWDLVVVHDDVLVAAFELKALGGPSYGNNYNNRVEEALGNAMDVGRLSVERGVGRELPWLGYFFVMQDDEGSRRSVQPQEGAFPADSAWLGRSYQQRFALTGKRLLDEGTYDGVCFVASAPDDPGPREPEPALDWRHFSAAIQGRIEYLKGLGLPK